MKAWMGYSLIVQVILCSNIRRYVLRLKKKSLKMTDLS